MIPISIFGRYPFYGKSAPSRDVSVKSEVVTLQLEGFTLDRSNHRGRARSRGLRRGAGKFGGGVRKAGIHTEIEDFTGVTWARQRMGGQLT